MVDVVNTVLLSLILILVITITIVSGFFVARVLPVVDDLGTTIDNINTAISTVKGGLDEILVTINSSLPVIIQLIASLLNYNYQSISQFIGILLNSNISIQQIKTLLASVQNLPEGFLSNLDGIASSINNIVSILESKNISPDQVGVLTSNIQEIMTRLSTLMGLVSRIPPLLRSEVTELLKNISSNNDSLSNFIKNVGINTNNILSFLNTNSINISQIKTVLENSPGLDTTSLSKIFYKLDDLCAANSKIIYSLSTFNNTQLLNISKIINDNNICINKISELIHNLSNLTHSTLKLINSKLLSILSSNESISILINQLGGIATHNFTNISNTIPSNYLIPKNSNNNNNKQLTQDSLSGTFQNVIDSIKS